MKILFIHQNFPGQFKFLAPALAAQGHDVLAFTPAPNLPMLWEGVNIIPYAIERGSTPGIHPWLVDLETKTIRGEAFFKKALEHRISGYYPDIVISHPGWGESLFVKDLWPNTKLGLYCEFYYQPTGSDTDFDPEFNTPNPYDACRLRLKNTNNLLHFEIAEAGISPTPWQASTFPEPFRSQISVIHDGIDTLNIKPDPNVSFSFNNMTFTKNDEVITFVNRNLEPYRGYHSFMRALPDLLQQRPKAQILIVGGNDVSYGSRPPEGQTWQQIFLDEVKDRIDLSRVHFVGKLAYPQFLKLLQVSRVHVYLTYPFVLSWSLLEAMSSACAIVASDTTPVRDVIVPGQTGLLVDFFAPKAIAENIIQLLNNPALRQELGENARTLVQQHYDLQSICLPKQIDWVNQLAKR